MARNHHDRTIRAEHRPQRASKAFAQSALDPVTNHRVADLARNRQSQPSRGLIGKLHQVNDEMRGLSADARTPQQQKIRAAMQAMLGAEAEAVAGFYPGCLGGIDTVRRWRPLVRRRLSTRRPLGDAIRARNPWVRFRRRLLG